MILNRAHLAFCLDRGLVFTPLVLLPRPLKRSKPLTLLPLQPVPLGLQHLPQNVLIHKNCCAYVEVSHPFLGAHVGVRDL